MIQTVYKKKEKSAVTQLLYFTLMVGTFVILQLSSIRRLRDEADNEWLVIAIEALFCLAMLLWFLVCRSDPGYLTRDESLNFTWLLETCEASSLCPDCQLVRTPTSRHCSLCNKCVDGLDHHCPWVNNCIGRGNFTAFYAFLNVQLLYLVTAVIVSA